MRIQKSAITLQDALPCVLEKGSEIQLGDIISTGKGSHIEIEMSDGAELTLGERTHFVVQEYVVDQIGNNAILRLLEGTFKVTSGKLMQIADASFLIKTAAAAIGIRDTTFWGGSLDGEFEVSGVQTAQAVLGGSLDGEFEVALLDGIKVSMSKPQRDG